MKRQPNYLGIKPEDAEKIKRRLKSKQPLTPTHYEMIAELGILYGWQAIHDFLDDYITYSQVEMFVKLGRKHYSLSVLDSAMAVRSGMVGGDEFKTLMAQHIKNTEI